MNAGRTHARPRKVPMSTAPYVLSRDGAGGSPGEVEFDIVPLMVVTGTFGEAARSC